MKPAPFDYHRATDVDDAVAALHAVEDGKAIAGGQSLIALLNLRLARPELLVDLNPLRDLDYIEPTPDGGLVIGAMTRQRAVERSALVRERCPIMFEAMPLVAHAAIRNRGTIGGSLAHADTGSELCTISLAVDARMRVRGQAGDREIKAADFFDGPLTTVLTPDEILTEIVVPPAPARSGAAFAEVSRRRGDFALAGVGGVVGVGEDGTVTHARLSYTSLGPTALRSPHAEESLLGNRLDEATIEKAASVVGEDLSPSDDLHATATFRLHLARALTRRVLHTAAGRAAT
ncbi:MAG TPA: xanthine dehydrogenase family protein subunit M [Pseudonocardiaceae bacterium]|jgi:carbon-monoxide dehydrogenase medium subunit